jgi:hypothetical protein
MSDYTPTELQMLDNIWSRLKKIDSKLEWIRAIAVLLVIVLIGYLLKR